MLKIVLLVWLLSVSLTTYAQESDYQKNLNVASELFLANSQIPDSVLLKLVPDNNIDFELLYGTTFPDNKMKNTGFFYKITQQIFDKIIIQKKEVFYLPSIQLASFADGEFGKDFTDNLEKIIKQSTDKFCRSVRDKKYSDHNPIKYYLIKNKCY